MVIGLLAWSGIGFSQLMTGAVSRPYGLDSRPVTQAYLRLPKSEAGAWPQLLSQTGAFQDTRHLTASESLIPYDLNVAFWSDGAVKQRWLAVPNDPLAGRPKIGFAPTGEWAFPSGTVFVKHFEIATNETQPELKRRLETRLLVRDADGGVYGATYKWRADNSDADLLSTNLTETILIKTAAGTRTQVWYYPSRQDCRTCHTDKSGGVLGLKTRQLNRDLTFPGGIIDNQLRAWNHVGLFEPALRAEDLPTYAKLAPAADTSRSLEARARSYLDANCAHCHRPGGTVAYFDARYDTPLAQQNLINGQVLINEGIDNVRIIAPHDIWRSLAYLRINTVEAIKMPPLAHEVLDHQNAQLLRQWIDSLPGPTVLAPVAFSKAGGSYSQPLELTLSQPEPGAVIHYTLDGSVPAKSDPVYQQPIRLTSPTTVRAKAFKPGFTKSITAQETYILDN